MQLINQITVITKSLLRKCYNLFSFISHLNTNKKTLLVCSTTVILVIAVLFFYKKSYYNFTIVFTSDVHAKVDQYLGYARLSTLIKDIEKKDSIRPLVFDCGDTFSGSPEAYLTNGQYIVDILNAVEYSAIGIGHWDFGYPKSVLNKIISNLSFPVVNTNVLNQNGEHEFRSSLIIPHRVNLFKKIKIGVISLLAPDSIEKIAVANIEEMQFSSSMELVQKEVLKLKDQGADLIVLLSHLNTQYNALFSQGEKTEFYLEHVLSKVKGIDIAIAGGVHFSFYHNKVMNDVPVFFASENLKYIGVLNIKKELSKKWNINLKNIEYEYSKDNIKPDPNIVKLIKDPNPDFEEEHHKVIGSSKEEIPLLYPKIRQDQTDLGRYLADILKANKNVDFSCLNAGALRRGIKKGDLTQNDILAIFPFNDKLVSVEITGEELKALLEKSYSISPNLFSGLLQLSSNVKFKLDLDEDPYNRISDIEISGKKLNTRKKYKVLLPDFLRNGGEGYDILKNKKIIKDFGYIYKNLTNYIENNSPISL